MRRDQFAELVGQLRLGQAVDLVIETQTDAPDGTGIGVDGLGPQALPLEVLEMGLVLQVEVGLRCRGGCGGRGGASSRKNAQSLPRISGSERAD